MDKELKELKQLICEAVDLMTRLDTELTEEIVKIKESQIEFLDVIEKMVNFLKGLRNE